MKYAKRLSACAIVALAGSSAGAQAIDWAMPIDGDWNIAGNWTGSNIPNAIGEDAVLGLAGAYTVTTSSNFTLGGMSITNPMATLTVGNNRTHTLNGTLINNGTVVVNTQGSVFNTHLSFASDATISGSGTIILNGPGDPGDAQVLSNTFTITHANGHTIRGAGNIAGNMINSGSIIADLDKSDGLRLSGVVTQTPTGVAQAIGSTLLLGDGSIVTGGELATSASGVVQVANGVATVGDIVLSGDLDVLGSTDTLALNGNLQNDGSININSNGAVFNAHVRFDTDAAINGVGVINMTAMSDPNDAQLYTNGVFDGTIGANQVVQGSGQIDGRHGGTMINLGTINGNNPEALELRGNHSGGGEYRSDSGLISLINGLIIDDGTFDSSGTGIVDMTGSGVATLSNMTNQGMMGIRGQTGFIDLAGPLTNNGTIAINSNNAIFNAHLRFMTDTVIDGTGMITMLVNTDNNDAQLFTGGVFNATLGAGQTVQGSGQIDGRDGGTIINLGTINGNDPVSSLELRGNHTGGGVYRSDNGSIALVNGLVLDDGTFDSSGTGVVEMPDGGVVTLSNITSQGEMGIRGHGGIIDLAGPLTNNGNIAINSNAEVFNAHIRFMTDTVIDGTGTITMLVTEGINDAQIFTGGIFNATLGAGQVIQGSGMIDGRDGGTVINLGTINGNDPAKLLELRGNHTGGGMYRSDNGSVALINGVSIVNGTFDSAGTGVVEMPAGGVATLTNITNQGEMAIRGQGGIIDLAGPFTNNGNIAINSNGAVFNAHIRFLTDGEIEGTGTINMATAGSGGDAQIIASDGFVGTLGAGQSIAGDGLLVGELNIDGTLNPGGLTREFNIDAVHLAPTSSMTFDLGGLAAGEFDRLVLGNSDTIDLDGTITMNLDSGYLPLFGDTWDIIDGGTINGQFDVEDMPDAGLGRVYRVVYENDRVYIVLTCDVDFSGDGTLNFFDVSAFLSLFNSQDVRGDLNNDGNFNFFDISIFLSLFTQSCD
tara:strand:+ start:272681 stop:275665 length:2985 start_codon:yes stop_codon:yes gene_type:complete